DNAKLEEATVEDAGESIEIGELLDSLDVVGVLNSRGTDVGHGLQRWGVALLKTAGLVAFEHEDTLGLAEGHQGDTHTGAGFLEEAQLSRAGCNIVLNQSLAF